MTIWRLAWLAPMWAMIAGAVIGLVGCSAAGPISTQPYASSGPMDARYHAHGPWAVTHSRSPQACDSKGHICDIWYPLNLGRNPMSGAVTGYRHAIVVWANGTGQTGERYAYLLRHLASWGFVVVAPRDTGTGNGNTILDATAYIRKQNQTSGSLFADRLDPDHIGVAGHSQGGSSVISLFARGNTPFTAFVTYHASPSLFARFCCDIRQGLLPDKLARGAILHFGGAGDPPAVQIGWYDATPAHTTKALGILAAAKHDDVMGTPKCRPDSNCQTGVDGYLGYSTAWLMWQLRGDEQAGHAFGRQAGEFWNKSPHWQKRETNIP